MVACALAALGSALPCRAGSALEAVRVLPAGLRSTILRVSADNANPDPPAWYFVCRKSHTPDGLVSVTVRGGEVSAPKPSLDLRVAFGENTKIDVSRVQVDSRGAWALAQRYAAEQGGELASASFALSQQGDGAAPVWSVWCYSRDGSYLGLVKILADSGDVVFAERAAPAPAPEPTPAPDAESSTEPAPEKAPAGSAVPPDASSSIQNEVSNLIQQ